MKSEMMMHNPVGRTTSSARVGSGTAFLANTAGAAMCTVASRQ